jgi:hypothetical protein
LPLTAVKTVIALFPELLQQTMPENNVKITVIDNKILKIMERVMPIRGFFPIQ